jgi:hypothetical protein
VKQDTLEQLTTTAKLRLEDRHNEAVKELRQALEHKLKYDASPAQLEINLADVLQLTYRWDDAKERSVAAFRVGSKGEWVIWQETVMSGPPLPYATVQWHLDIIIDDGPNGAFLLSHEFRDTDELLLLIDKHRPA